MADEKPPESERPKPPADQPEKSAVDIRRESGGVSYETFSPGPDAETTAKRLVEAVGSIPNPSDLRASDDKTGPVHSEIRSAAIGALISVAVVFGLSFVKEQLGLLHSLAIALGLALAYVVVFFLHAKIEAGPYKRGLGAARWIFAFSFLSLMISNNQGLERRLSQKADSLATAQESLSKRPVLAPPETIRVEPRPKIPARAQAESRTESADVPRLYKWPLIFNQPAIGKPMQYALVPYTGPCDDLPPGQDCITFRDGYRLLVVDSLMGGTLTRGSALGDESQMERGMYMDYQHDLGSSTVVVHRRWDHKVRAKR